MKSLLFQEDSVLSVPAGCGALPCRQEFTINIRKFNRIYRYVLRDKIVPEDPYLVMTKAVAFALRTGEPYNGRTPPRSLKDFLIKDSVVI
jgi:hypothetical protein